MGSSRRSGEWDVLLLHTELYFECYSTQTKVHAMHSTRIVRKEKIPEDTQTDVDVVIVVRANWVVECR